MPDPLAPLDRTARELVESMIARGLPVECMAFDHPATGPITLVVARGPAARALQVHAFGMAEAALGRLPLYIPEAAP